MEHRQIDFVIQFGFENWIIKSFCLCSTTDGTFLRNLYLRRRRTGLSIPSFQIRLIETLNIIAHPRMKRLRWNKATKHFPVLPCGMTMRCKNCADSVLLGYIPQSTWNIPRPGRITHWWFFIEVWVRYTGLHYKAVPRLRECCRQVEAEVVRKSRNKIHQTKERPYNWALHTYWPGNRVHHW